MGDGAMFDPLPGAAGERRSPERAATASGAGAWRPVVPVPADAPPPPVGHPTRGKPIAEWTYRDGDGRVLGFFWRFNESDGGKAFIPLTWCKHSDTGRGEWRWKNLPVPRPLYRLDALAAHREARVIVCEGEKASDAAAKLLPGWVSTTSPNGTNSAGKADWAPLAGRRVVIWPDADVPGMKYAASVARALARGSAAVLVIAPPADATPGWDAADALVEGWDKDRALALAEAARPLSETMLKVHGTADETPPDGSDSKRKQKGVGSKLVEFAGEAELWHSPDREPHATVLIGDHHEHWPVKSKNFRRWLAGRYYDDGGGVPSGQALQDALNIIEMKALRGPEYRIFLRVGERKGNVYLDLGDEAWRAVEITKDGWELIRCPPVKFLRTGAMRALPEPERGESIDALRPFLNTATEADFLLVVACLVGWLRPRGPYPILTIAGEQGSAKSTMTRVVRDVIDPRTAGLRSLPRDERDLFVAVYNSWVLAFDNVSKLPDWLSDGICRITSGGGFGTRELHSDRDETIFDGARPVLLNGIPDLASRADLGDRAIAITLAAIPDTARRSEAALAAEFEAARPAILGALLDAVVGALKCLSEVELDCVPRMADFALWVVAAEKSLGWEPGSFMEAYEANRAGAVELSIENDPVATAVRAFVESVGDWNGSATDLLAELAHHVSDKIRDSKIWPPVPSALGVRLRRAAPGLRQVGIEIEPFRGGTKGRPRLIFIRRREDS